MKSKLFFIIIASLFAFSFSACKKDKEKKDDHNNKGELLILDFFANKESISAGESVEFTWETQNAEEVFLNPGIGKVDLSGKVTVPDIKQTTTFTLVAKNKVAEVTSLPIIVKVINNSTVILCFAGGESKATEKTPCEDILEGPSIINCGQEVFLKWSVENADTIELSPKTDCDTFGLTGECKVSPTQDTTYTLKAFGKGEPVEKTFEVKVEPSIPNIVLDVSIGNQQGPIHSGDTAIVSWDVSCADSIQITQEISKEVIAEMTKAGVTSLSEEQPVYSGAELQGTHQISPMTPLAFVVKAYYDGGQKSATQKKEVNVLPTIVQFKADRTNINNGEKVVLVWETSGTSSISISGIPEGGDAYDVKVNPFNVGYLKASSLEVRPEGKTKYVLKAYNLNGKNVAEKEQSIEVNPYPRIDSFTASRLFVLAHEKTILKWKTSGTANKVKIEGNNQGVLVDSTSISGEKEVSIANTEEFTLTAYDDKHSIGEKVKITVQKPVVIESFTADPEVISKGGSSTLSWKVKESDTIIIQNSLGVTLHTSVNLNGTFVVSPQKAETYTLIASNAADSKAMTEVTVYVDPAEILAFEADPALLISGKTSTLTWSTKNADGVIVLPTDYEAEILSASNWIDISSSGTKLEFDSFVDPGTGNTAYDSDEDLIDTAIDIGFEFSFYGNTYQQVYVSTNGFITFDPTSPPSSTTNIFDNEVWPDAEKPNNVIAPFWDDLIGNRKDATNNLKSAIYFEIRGSAPERELVIQWSKFGFYQITGAEINFQAVLFEDGHIEFNYGQLTKDQNFAARSEGAQATIGVENIDGSIFTAWSNDGMYIDSLGPQTRVIQEFSSLSFHTPILPANGTLVVNPDHTTLYTLIAMNADGGSDIATLEVQVIPNNALVINEFLANPKFTSAPIGQGDAEYIELYNSTNSDIDITNWELSDDSTDYHVFNSTGPILVPAHGYLVLGSYLPPSTNQSDLGRKVGYYYPYTDFQLNNLGEDQIVLSYSGVEIDRVQYDTTWDIATGGSAEGMAYGLIRNLNSFENDLFENWCVQTEVISTQNENTGSPGFMNDSCVADNGDMCTDVTKSVVLLPTTNDPTETEGSLSASNEKAANDANGIQLSGTGGFDRYGNDCYDSPGPDVFIELHFVTSVKPKITVTSDAPNWQPIIYVVEPQCLPSEENLLACGSPDFLNAGVATIDLQPDEDSGYLGGSLAAGYYFLIVDSAAMNESGTFSVDVHTLKGPEPFYNAPVVDTFSVANDWIELSTSQTASVTDIFSSDGRQYLFEDLATPFNFNYFGIEYDSIKVSVNGILSFDPTIAFDWNHYAIPRNSSFSDFDSFMAVYWRDLGLPADTLTYPGSVDGTIYYQAIGQSPNRTYVIQWNHLHNDPNSVDAYMDFIFEAILHEADGKIEFLYKQMFSTDVTLTNCGDATIGLEDSTEDPLVSTEYCYNTAKTIEGNRVTYTPIHPIE